MTINNPVDQLAILHKELTVANQTCETVSKWKQHLNNQASLATQKLEATFKEHAAKYMKTASATLTESSFFQQREEEGIEVVDLKGASPFWGHGWKGVLLTLPKEMIEACSVPVLDMLIGYEMKASPLRGSLVKIVKDEGSPKYYLFLTNNSFSQHIDFVKQEGDLKWYLDGPYSDNYPHAQLREQIENKLDPDLVLRLLEKEVRSELGDILESKLIEGETKTEVVDRALELIKRLKKRLTGTVYIESRCQGKDDSLLPLFVFLKLGGGLPTAYCGLEMPKPQVLASAYDSVQWCAANGIVSTGD